MSATARELFQVQCPWNLRLEQINTVPLVLIRFAVVRDDFDRNQDRMHLDCVFSIISDNCCIMLEDIMGIASPTRRLVDEYVRDAATGKYKLGRWVWTAGKYKIANRPSQVVCVRG